MGCKNNPILHAALHILHFLVGVGMLAISSLTLSVMGQFGDILPDGSYSLPVIVVIEGIVIIIMILMITGCFGARKYPLEPGGIYWLSIILVFLAGILIIIMLSGGNLFKDDIWKRFDMYENPNETDLTLYMDQIQTDLQCCGVDGPEDWKNASYLDGLSVPDGCCRTLRDGCGTDYFNHISAVDIYGNGCYNVIMDKFSSFGPWFTGFILTSFGAHMIMCILSSESPGMRTLCSNDQEDSSVNTPQVVESQVESTKSRHSAVSSTISSYTHKDSPCSDAKPLPPETSGSSISVVGNSRYIAQEPAFSNDTNFKQHRFSSALPSTYVPTYEASSPNSPTPSYFNNKSYPTNPSFSIPNNNTNPTMAYPSSDLLPAYVSCVPVTEAPLPYNPSSSYSNNFSYPTNPSYTFPSNTSNSTTAYPSSDLPPANTSSAPTIPEEILKDDIRKHFEDGIHIHRLITSKQTLLYKRDVTSLNLLKTALDKDEVRFSFDNEIGNMKALLQGIKLLVGDEKYEIVWTRTSPGWQ